MRWPLKAIKMPINLLSLLYSSRRYRSYLSQLYTIPIYREVLRTMRTLDTLYHMMTLQTLNPNDLLYIVYMFFVHSKKVISWKVVFTNVTLTPDMIHCNSMLQSNHSISAWIKCTQRKATRTTWVHVCHWLKTRPG